MSNVASIKLPTARAEQFRAVAAAAGLTITGLIERIIAQAQAANVIGLDLPGFAVEAFRADSPQGLAFDGLASVEIALGHIHLPRLDLPIAGFVANVIETLATKRGRDAVQVIKLSDTVTLTLARRGNGILLSVALDGHAPEVSTFSFSMALDLVAMIRRAILAADAASAD